MAKRVVKVTSRINKAALKQQIQSIQDRVKEVSLMSDTEMCDELRRVFPAMVHPPEHVQPLVRYRMLVADYIDRAIPVTWIE